MLSLQLSDIVFENNNEQASEHLSKFTYFVKKENQKSSFKQEA